MLAQHFNRKLTFGIVLGNKGARLFYRAPGRIAALAANIIADTHAALEIPRPQLTGRTKIGDLHRAGKAGAKNFLRPRPAGQF